MDDLNHSNSSAEETIQLRQDGAIEERLRPSRPSTDVAIQAADVLCGKGRVQFHHPGNKRLRDSVSKSLPEYLKASTREEKSRMIHGIINDIRNTGGRFLKKNNITGSWGELENHQIKEKVAHSLRDLVSVKRGHKRKKTKTAGKDVSGMKPPPEYAQAHNRKSTIPSPMISRHTASQFLLPAETSVQTGNYPASAAAASAAAAAAAAPAPVSVPSNTLGQIRSPVPEHASLGTRTHSANRQEPNLYYSEGAVEETKDHQFLEKIDDALGPLHPDVPDPMDRFFEEE